MLPIDIELDYAKLDDNPNSALNKELNLTFA